MSEARDAPWIVPPALVPGDRVRVIAPSSPFDRALALRGLAWLRERYRVEFDQGIFARDRFFAGSDARRLTELDRALTEPGIAAVIAVRGGYGLGRIVHRAAIAAVRKAPRWVVGFSDVTALHVELAATHVGSLHATMVAGLGRGDAAGRARWLRALEHPELASSHSGLDIWVQGAARGRLFGGNLTVLFTAAAAGRLRIPEGAILLLEDVTEPSYRLDRMLTALLVSGALDRVAGVVVGELTDCSPGLHGVPPSTVLRERLATLGVPVLAGLPVGHGSRNDPMLLGGLAELDADVGTLTVRLVR